MSRYDTVMRVIEEEMAEPYQYGEADCFLLGCCMADALDPSRRMYATYAGTYKTQKQAQRLTVEMGCRSLVEVLGQHLERCPPAAARLGDLVVVNRDGEEHVAICTTSARFLGKTPAGPVWFALGDVIAAFRT